ncbi:hypothetical protein ABZ215_33430 [Amycolatopsis sp. NPDC006131]|uniref:hypothetical protein n=1 Tax=Amycolatopsis sp. NPDC006131 TaxID=3156731 RepID=UPI0033A27EA8
MWAACDQARDNGAERSAPEFHDDRLVEAWYSGYDGAPLPYWGVDTPRLVGRHDQGAVPVPRYVKSLRAQCGLHSWTTGPARHAADLREAVAS